MYVYIYTYQHQDLARGRGAMLPVWGLCVQVDAMRSRMVRRVEPKPWTAIVGALGPIPQRSLGYTLLCSSFLVMTCFLVRGENILRGKALHRSLQVGSPRLLGPTSVSMSIPVCFWLAWEPASLEGLVYL